MPEMSFEQVRRIAANLGHTNLHVVSMGNGFYRCECRCGFRSTRAALEVEAVKAAVHHLELVATGDWEKPKFLGGPTHAQVLARILKGEEKVRRRQEADRTACAVSSRQERSDARHAG